MGEVLSLHAFFIFHFLAPLTHAQQSLRSVDFRSMQPKRVSVMGVFPLELVCSMGHMH